MVIEVVGGYLILLSLKSFLNFKTHTPKVDNTCGLCRCCSWQAKEFGAISRLVLVVGSFLPPEKQWQNNELGGATPPSPATTAGAWPKPGQKWKRKPNTQSLPLCSPFKCKSVRKSSNDFDWFSGLGFCFCRQTVPRRQVLDKGPAVFGHF